MITNERYKTVDHIIPTFDVTAWSGFTNQPDGDKVEIVSNNAADTGLITIFGTVKTTGEFKYETITLKGTTAVATTEEDWDDIYGAFLGDIYGKNIKAAAGTITIREATGDQAITTLTTGKISTGHIGFDMLGKNIRIRRVSGNLYYKNGEPATTANGHLLDAGEPYLNVVNDGIFYLISDGSAATAKITVFKG
jgi:hypothetical protein